MQYDRQHLMKWVTAEVLSNLFRSYVPLCHRPLPLPRPLFASWPKQLISCTLAHGQPFLYFFCKSVIYLEVMHLFAIGHYQFKKKNSTIFKSLNLLRFVWILRTLAVVYSLAQCWSIYPEWTLLWCIYALLKKTVPTEKKDGMWQDSCSVQGNNSSLPTSESFEAKQLQLQFYKDRERIKD